MTNDDDELFETKPILRFMIALYTKCIPIRQ